MQLHLSNGLFQSLFLFVTKYTSYGPNNVSPTFHTPCPEKKNLRSSVNNFSKFKDIFTISCTHYPDDTFYYNHSKFVFEIAGHVV